MNKPELRYDSRGESGNIFWILGATKRILKELGRSAEYDELWKRIRSAGSYEEALGIIGEKVTLIDTAN